MDFRKTMELVAANCKRHKYYCANGYKCPLLKVPDDGGRYCLLGLHGRKMSTEFARL